MVRRLGAVLAIGALLLVAQNAAAYHEEVRLEKATLSDVRAVLFGDPAKPGLVDARRHFKATFRDVILTHQDAPGLRQILQDAAMLPPDSNLMIQGSIDGKPFDVRMRNNEKGHKEARLDGLIFANRHEALSFLESLKDHGIREARLRGSVEGQRVEGKIEDGKPKFEG